MGQDDDGGRCWRCNRSSSRITGSYSCTPSFKILRYWSIHQGREPEVGQAAVAHEDVAVQQQPQLARGKMLEGRFKTYCSSCCFRSISTFKLNLKLKCLLIIMILLFIYPSMKKKTGQTGDPVSPPQHQKRTRWACAQCLPPAPALGLDTAHA